MLRINDRFGLVIQKGELPKLKELCVRYKIPITYEGLFEKGNRHQSLWCLDSQGIGLVGTIIMRHFSNSGVTIIHGVKELEQYLEYIKQENN